jgi:hypothetical protein
MSNIVEVFDSVTGELKVYATFLGVCLLYVLKFSIVDPLIISEKSAVKFSTKYISDYRFSQV